MDGQQESFSRGRAWAIAFHVVLSSIAFLALVVMGNYLAHRHNQRLYLSKGSAQKLSPLTLRVLANLTNDVKAIVFFDRREALFGSVSTLIKEYQTHSTHIDVEFVDYRMPGRAVVIRNQYKLQTEGDTSRVIFDSGGQVRTILSTELSEYGVNPNKEITRTGFRGEQLFTTAILNITETKSVSAYFMQGHGEQTLGTDDQAFSRFGKLLQNNNVIIRTATPLIGTNTIPEDCGLLIIAGPTTTYETEELVKMDQYLSRGGRLLVLMNIAARLAPLGLEQLLYKWNVQVGFDLVRDPEQSQANNQNVLITSHYGSHPIVRSLLRSSLSIIAPRSISLRATQQPAADAPKITELFFTSPSGFALVASEGNRGDVHRQGAIPLAVAGERGAIQGVKTARGATRFVVVGDALFLSNMLFGHSANSDFASLALNWLLNRDTLLHEIGPSPVSEYEIVLTEKQMSQIRWLFLGAIPGVVMIFGFFVWLRRRV